MKLARVLRGDHEKGFFERPRRALDGDLALPHPLEQPRLTPGRCPVDLVRQHDVGEDRPGYELEAQVFLVEDARARDVGREQVRRALDAAEGPAHRSRQCPSQHGLAGAGEVLKEDMPATEKPRDGEAHRALLADDDAMNVLLNPAEKLSGTLRLKGSILGCRHGQKSRTAAPVFPPCVWRGFQSLMREAPPDPLNSLGSRAKPFADTVSRVEGARRDPFDTRRRLVTGGATGESSAVQAPALEGSCD